MFNSFPKIFFVFLIFFQSLNAQTTLMSWNLKDFGNSKSDTEINFIANTLKNYDVVAIQEVVAGEGGAQAVARLAGALNRKGSKWDYTISNPTSSTNSYKVERYAFIWKTNKLKKIGDAWLEKKYHLEIDREPYFITFKQGDETFTVCTFHAITKTKQPEREIKYFRFIPAEYPNLNIIFCGDYNCPQSHSVFNPLKSMGYLPILKNQKTSLKLKCVNNNCLASEFDNMFCNSKFKVINSSIIPFHNQFATLTEARQISDHVPILLEFKILPQ
jgi:endonuclease/exonuclease/phosphatase family metal-dependent hydrolase